MPEPVASARESGALKSRVLRADRAVRCCLAGASRTQAAVGLILSDAFDIVEGLKKNDIVVKGAGGLGVVTGFVRSPATGALTDFELLLQKAVTPTNLKEIGDFERLVAQNVKWGRSVPKGAIISPGGIAVVLGIGATAYFLDVAAKTAALETLTMVAEAITSLRPETDCEGCVRRAILSQSKARKTVKKKSRIRV